MRQVFVQVLGVCFTNNTKPRDFEWFNTGLALRSPAGPLADNVVPIATRPLQIVMQQTGPPHSSQKGS